MLTVENTEEYRRKKSLTTPVIILHLTHNKCFQNSVKYYSAHQV